MFTARWCALRSSGVIVAVAALPVRMRCEWQVRQMCRCPSSVKAQRAKSSRGRTWPQHAHSFVMPDGTTGAGSGLGFGLRPPPGLRLRTGFATSATSATGGTDGTDGAKETKRHVRVFGVLAAAMLGALAVGAVRAPQRFKKAAVVYTAAYFAFAAASVVTGKKAK